MHISSHKFLTVLACGASLVFATTMRAEEGGKSCPAGGHHAGARFEKLSEKLNLTADQQAQIKPILEAAHAQAAAARQDDSLTREQKFAKAKEARQAAMGHIKGLLMPEQQQKLEQLKEERHERRAEKS